MNKVKYLKDWVGVIALNFKQYEFHLKDLPEGRDYFYVSGRQALLGREDIDFELVGQWYYREDLTEIMEELWRRNINNGVLREKVEKFLHY